MLVLLACTSTITARYAEPAAIEGHVYLDDGTPVAGAEVLAGDDGTTTDVEGAFSFADLDAGRTELRVHTTGATTAERAVTLEAGVTSELSMTVRALTRLQLADATAGGELRSDDGLSVTFAPGGLRREDGQPLSGAVDVDYALYDSNLSLVSAPGGLMAQTAKGTQSLLVSNGMSEVRLSQDGVPVELTSPARLSFPVIGNPPPPGKAFTSYWYDDDEGVWEQQGAGEVQENRFVTDVEHFSTWNCDEDAEYAGCITATLLRDGEPLANRFVAGWLSDGGYQGDDTDSTGSVWLYAREGSLVTLALAFDAEGRVDERGVDAAWSLGPVEIPAAEDGCFDFGEVEVTGVDMDEDGVGIAPWGNDCYDRNALDTMPCPNATRVTDTGFGFGSRGGVGRDTGRGR